MHRRGIRVLPGGDYGFAWTPHGTYARDLQHFVERLGFTPMEAILSATAQGGQIMLRPGELGKVQPSYLADLLLVDGNPLDDITILQDHDKLNYIMKDGRFHSEPGDHDAPPPSRDELVTTSTQAVFEQRP
jgi:imidazolonepropionase-like amidohydrolase